jgi:hypothetical protein
MTRHERNIRVLMKKALGLAAAARDERDPKRRDELRILAELAWKAAGRLRRWLPLLLLLILAGCKTDDAPPPPSLAAEPPGQAAVSEPIPLVLPPKPKPKPPNWVAALRQLPPEVLRTVLTDRLKDMQCEPKEITRVTPDTWRCTCMGSLDAFLVQALPTPGPTGILRVWKEGGAL